ncbi:flagellar assembly protein FliH [Metabacillus indicus]|uniref:flagellar assembly protein FliH n=1 Tax=Metabacillus indicus TaxID=246786 RepID=UPI003CE7A64D
MSNLIKSDRAAAEQGKKAIILRTVLSAPTEKINPEMVMHQAKADADQLLEHARVQADRILMQAKDEQEKWISEKKQQELEAREEGFQAGFETGRQEALQQYSSFLSEAKTIVEQAKEDYIEKVSQSEETIINLAVKLSEKIMYIKLEEHPACFADLVKKALHEVREHPEIKVFVNPLYYSRLLKQKSELEDVLLSKADLFIYPDESLQEGSCVIESPSGTMDAGVDAQLNQLKKSMLQLIGED